MALAEDVLARVLRKREEAIIDRWSKEIRASSPRYADQPLEDLRESAKVMLDGLRTASSKGDYSPLFEFLNRIVPLRSSAGFKLSEVQRVINIGTGILFEEMAAECGAEDTDECFVALRRLIDVTAWASLNLGDTFEEIRKREFAAGTLVALEAAQEEMGEQQIMRKSLGAVMDLMKCSQGAISLHKRQTPMVMVPQGNGQVEELFEKISGMVASDKKAFLLHREDISELVNLNGRRSLDAVSCAAGIPIRTRGSVIGALLLGSDAERRVSPNEVLFLEAVASQIGLACDNARLMEKALDRERFIKKEHDEVLTVMNELGAMVYVADMSTYELLAANRAIQEAYGKDIVGKICHEVLQADQGGPCSFCTNKLLVKDGKPTGVHVWKFKNTRTGRLYQLSDRAIEWPDRRLVRLEIALDITELEEARTRLERISSTLELYNDLLVHDIGNYASTASAFVQLIADPETPPEKKKDMAKSALDQVGKIETVVHRVSLLTKAHTKAQWTLAPTDLSKVLDDAVSYVSSTVEGTGVEFRKEYQKGGYLVNLGDFAPAIFENLLGNAAKYGEGRPVTAKISEATLRGSPAWRVSITDEGEGIPPEKKGRLFERYERLTTMSQLKGIGLGLAIVRTLTDAYGGEVRLEDRVEGDYTKGSVFSVTFPKATPAAG